ncbi:MAG: transmembrane anchor protein [Myxococcota bacterium]|nr:transmembrane anchor protein [Deltaproteobacteria bacterium]MDQ3336170.1 transmembrane anchor protein [Myxococcota bacterium]
MTEPTPPAGDLPSTRTLLRSTAIAAVVATALLVTVVLPAEYGVDPTGIGDVLGLTEMGKTKLALEKEAAVAAQPATAAAVPCPPPPAPVAAPEVKAPPAVAKLPSDVTQVTLKPGEGKEVKLTMREGARVSFSWATDKGVVNYDLHSDNPTTGAYHGYGKGKGLGTHEGVLVAAFEGRHGWFWRNRTKDVITITLKTDGDYQEIKELK